MRTVAIVLTLISVLALVPHGLATDECQNNAGAAQVCVTLPAAKPSTPPPAPAVPNEPYWGTYYLYEAGLACESPTSPACRGIPSGPGSGIVLPTGGTVGVGVFGVLWQESNGVSGLQRSITSNGGLKPADRMVLV